MSRKGHVDVVIPYHEKDKSMVEMCVASCVKNVTDVRDIYVVPGQMVLK